MPGASTSNPLPRPALYGVAAVLAFTVLAVMIGRGEGVGLTELPPGVPLASVDFAAEDQPDGSIVMRDAADRHVITTIRPGEDGFIRGTLRGLAQARQRAGLGREAPFRLTRFEDGRLALEDGATGRKVPLEAFGPTNALAFARLLPAGSVTEPKEAQAE